MKQKTTFLILIAFLIVIAATVAAIYLFTGNGLESNKNSILVTNIEAGDEVSSPLTIEGKARGSWFFEGSFPVQILNGEGNEIGSTTAQTSEDWMTEDFINFTAKIAFAVPSTETGTLVLKKDNPSGLPENEDSLETPIKFAPAFRTVTVYLYSQSQDTDANGNVMCSAMGLVPVERKIRYSNTPIQDTIKELLSGSITDSEKLKGYSTEFPLSDFTLVGADIEDKHLTLEFQDPQNKSNGGSCRVGILWMQISKTAMQFNEVDSVSYIPDSLFQP